MGSGKDSMSMKLKGIEWRFTVAIAWWALYLAVAIIGVKFDYWDQLWFTALICGVSCAAMGIFWSKFSKKFWRGEDSVLWYPTHDEAYFAASEAHRAMEDAGITYEKVYMNRWFDCTQFCNRMLAHMEEHFRTLDIGERKMGKGVPVARFDYTKDNGIGHSIIEAKIVGGKSIFFDVYPGHPIEIMLSKKEFKSCPWRNF